MALTREEAEKAFLNNLIGYDTYQQALQSQEVPINLVNPQIPEELAPSLEAELAPKQFTGVPGFFGEPGAAQMPPQQAQAQVVPELQQSSAQPSTVDPVQKQMDAGVIPQPEQPSTTMLPTGQQSAMQISSGLPSFGSETEKVYKESKPLYEEAKQKIDEQERQRIKDMELMQKRNEDLDNQFNKLKDAYNKFDQVKDIDPGRYYANMSTGAKISGLLAAAFGGYAQSYTGGRNIGLDAIDKAVNDDIQAQKVNFEKAKNTLEAQESLYGKMYQITKDKTAAELAVRSAMTESILKKLDIMSAKANNAKTIDDINLKKQELRVKAQQEQAALSAKLAENANANYQAQRVTSGPFAATSKYVVENLPQLIKENKVKIVETPMGVPLVADNEKFAEEAVNANRVHALMSQNLDRLAQIQKGGLLDMQSRNEFERLKSNMVSLIKEQKSLGALDNGLLQFGDKLLSGINYQSLTSDPQKAIASYKKQMDQEYTALLRATYPVMSQNIKSSQDLNEEDKKSGRKITFK